MLSSHTKSFDQPRDATRRGDYKPYTRTANERRVARRLAVSQSLANQKRTPDAVTKTYVCVNYRLLSLLTYGEYFSPNKGRVARQKHKRKKTPTSRFTNDHESDVIQLNLCRTKRQPTAKHEVQKRQLAQRTPVVRSMSPAYLCTDRTGDKAAAKVTDVRGP
ncbi:unnamed protein product [Soboliphyme baturini]|uniref:Uncharacterized protein n=1 Tax=Soboliphyme baturini TaxID=241478 RepID=A0A3P8CSP5_9BILA|nr:unnamed protein product [Soboliphyme baturini]